MKKRVAKIIGLALLAPVLAYAALTAAASGRARTGRIGGFREVQEAQEPFLYFAFTIGYFVASAALFYMLWREIAAFREWRRLQRGDHRLSGIIDSP